MRDSQILFVKPSLVALLVLLLASFPSNCSGGDLRLWYTQPADAWVEALPVGNGSMGAMVYGTVAREHIQFNEDTLWTGKPRDYSHPGASKHLSEIRRLLLSGKQREAERLAQKEFMSVPLHQERYQAFGDLWIEFDNESEVNDYHRELDLETGISTVSYVQDGVTYKRQTFASHPDGVIVVHLSASQPGSLSCQARLSTPHKESSTSLTNEGKTLVLSGRPSSYDGYEHHESVLRFESRLKLYEHDGELRSEGGKVRIENATSATFILTAKTSFVSFEDVSADPSQACIAALEAVKSPYEELRQRHIQDHQSLFNRVSINLGSTEQANKPTDIRIEEFRESSDPQLLMLLYQYGRYLMIASSRPGSQPANLQGLWNDSLTPAWESKYTLNINAEMNYWPAEMANLSECHEPFLQLVKDCAKSGAKVAKCHYDCRGWVAHHNTDLWRGAAPINASNHGIWVTGGAWISQHLWWHYEFTQDEEFLRTEAYPVLKEASLFFVDFLMEDPRNDKGWLISGPSNSPEQGGLVMGPTMDHQIIRNLFRNTISASEFLSVDKEFRDELIKLHDQIAPNQIGKHGQLQEWLEDVDLPENKHRHISHLWGLHPGSEITKEETPDLFEAAKKSLEMRGDGATGWSMGWKVNCWARLKDGDHAYLLLRNLLTPSNSQGTTYGGAGAGVYPNLFDAHPPFQIDGNFGAVAGITEMLVQSHRRTKEGVVIIDLLPAIPAAFPTGSITGIRTRDGFEVDVHWQDGKLTKATIQSSAGKPCVIQYPGGVKALDLEDDGVEILQF